MKKLLFLFIFSSLSIGCASIDWGPLLNAYYGCIDSKTKQFYKPYLSNTDIANSAVSACIPYENDIVRVRPDLESSIRPKTRQSGYSMSYEIINRLRSD